MEYVNAVWKALTYIEEHLNDELNLPMVAKEAGYSLYHFHRVFRGVVGDSMKEYIRKRRITEAAKELVDTGNPIIDIATKYGYQSREAFSRAFEKDYGRNPLEVKREGILYYIREPMTYDYMVFEYKRQKNGMEPYFQRLPEMLIVGKKYKIEVDDSNFQEIPLLWQEWGNGSGWTCPEERNYNDDLVGISIFSEEDTFEYMIGYEAETIDNIPNNMDLYRIAPSLYAVFRTIGPITESVQKTLDYIYTIWFNESHYKHAGTYDIECYYYDQGELIADIYIPIEG